MLLVESDPEPDEPDAELVPVVLCIQVAARHHDELLRLLQRHGVSHVVDGRVQREGPVAQLRRACAARGVDYEHRPALSSRLGAEAAQRAALVLRLQVAARDARAAGERGLQKGWPCVLFGGEDSSSRERLALELQQREVRLKHVGKEPPPPKAQPAKRPIEEEEEEPEGHPSLGELGRK